jgi:argininosuccinate lyase
MQALPNQITLMINNLPSGYFRDLQLVKEVFIPAFAELNDCLEIANFAIANLTVNESILDDERYKYMYSVEEVNRRVLSGVPFRDAYREVGEEINRNEFQPDKMVHHTHEGSIGNLCLEEINQKMEGVLKGFSFVKVDVAFQRLLGEE